MQSLRYQPLDHSRKEIRILCLQAADNFADPLSGYFTHRSLDSPRFEDLYSAISWSRDPDDKFQSIVIDGTGEIAIGSSIGNCLRRVRRADTPHFYWIDYLCINQEDIDERNNQAKLMRLVYENALATLVWLGEETVDSRGAVSILKGVEGVFLDVISDKLPTLRYSSREWHAASALLLHPYFSRIKAVQELVFSRRCYFLHGRGSLAFSSLEFVVDQLERKFAQSPSFLPNYAEVQLEGATRMLRAVRDCCVRDQDGNFESLYWPLSKLVPTFKDLKAFDPRDMIYGLLLLATDQDLVTEYVQVDYSRTLEEVHNAFLRYCSAKTIVSEEPVLSWSREVWSPSDSKQVSSDNKQVSTEPVVRPSDIQRSPVFQMTFTQVHYGMSSESKGPGIEMRLGQAAHRVESDDDYTARGFKLSWKSPDGYRGRGYYLSRTTRAILQLRDCLESAGLQGKCQEWDPAHPDDSLLELLVSRTQIIVSNTIYGLRSDIHVLGDTLTALLSQRSPPWLFMNTSNPSSGHTTASSSRQAAKSGLTHSSIGSSPASGTTSVLSSSASNPNPPSAQSIPTVSSTTAPTIVPVWEDYILLCLKTGPHFTRWIPISVTPLADDKALFLELRKRYEAQFAWLYRTFGIWGIQRIKFIEFGLQPVFEVNGHRYGFPQSSEQHYDFHVRPPGRDPPFDSDYLVYRFLAPENCKTGDDTCLQQIPKRLQEIPVPGQAPDMFTGWGILLEESWSGVRIAKWMVLLFASTLVFGITWAVLKGIQDAFSMAGYMITTQAAGLAIMQLLIMLKAI